MDEPHGNAVAVSERLRRRADFLRAAKGKRFYARGLTLQSVPRPMAPSEPLDFRAPGVPKAAGAPEGKIPMDTPRSASFCMAPPPRFGFTVTKQSGGAVQRNRIRRRLKEALRLLKPLPARPGHDYVIVAKPEALRMSFRALQEELVRAFQKIDIRKNPPHPDHGCNGPVFVGAGEARRKRSQDRTPKG